MVDGLTQGLLDQLALDGAAMLGDRMELVTYYAQSGPTATPVTHSGLQVALEAYSLHELGAMVGQSEIIQTDRKCRIRTALISWTPTQYDEFVRTDNTRWRVLSGTDGTHRPWTLLPSRQVA
jgi:hypothetical protein